MLTSDFCRGPYGVLGFEPGPVRPLAPVQDKFPPAVLSILPYLFHYLGSLVGLAGVAGGARDLAGL